MDKVAETADRVIRCARRVIADIGVDQHLERSRSVVVVTSREQWNEKSLDDTLNDARVASHLRRVTTQQRSEPVV